MYKITKEQEFMRTVYISSEIIIITGVVISITGHRPC